MTEYYENGPEGMPRVERMTRSTIMAVLSQKDVPTIYVSREEDYNSLCKFAHAVAEETLARVPAWPVERSLSAQDEVLTKIPRFNIDVDAGGDDIQEVPYPTGDFCRFEDVQALLAAAAPAPIQQDSEAPARQALHTMQYEDGRIGWYFDCDGHYIDVEKDDAGKYSVYFRDRATGKEGWLDQADTAIPPALAGSQVQAAGDDINYENLLSKYIDHVANEEGTTLISSLYRDVDGSYYGMGKDVKFSADEFEALRKCSEKY